MGYKCYTKEAREFETLLNELGITYNQFNELNKKHNELSMGGKAEVADNLKETENMADNKKKYNVTWMNESGAEFDVELTDSEKDIIVRFLNTAAEHVEDFDMPSVYFNDEHCGGI